MSDLLTAIERRTGDLGGGVVLAVVTDPAESDRAAAEAVRRKVPFLGIHIEPGRVVIGPAVRPGVAGCHICLARRRRAIDPDGADDRAAIAARAVPVALTPFAVALVAAIVAAEAIALAGGGPARTSGAVVTVALEHLLPSTHPLQPDPHCPNCASPEPDRAARLVFAARPKPRPEVLRASDVAARAGPILASCVDDFAGVVPAVFDSDACGLPMSFAPTGWPDRAKPEYGVGRGVAHHASAIGAVLEALERRAGMRPARTPVRARFTDVAAHAIDPRTLGQPEPDSGYRPFDADREIGWVWGWSCLRAEPVLVPRSIAYFGHDHGPGGEVPFAYETSNGCALGGCVEEAVLHGLLEVAERDAFLLTWYARLPARRVAPRSARRPEVPLLAERIEREHGYRVHVVDTTAEHGLPSVAVLAVDRQPSEDRPVVLCSAGAHLDPEAACFGALGELALLVSRQVEEYPAKRADAAAMARDPELVRHMDDHALLYGHTSTLPRWDFLLGGGDGETTFDAAFAGRPAPADDLRDDLLGAVARFGAAGMDVVVVDQTGPEQRAHGLFAAKVIVPGALPMTFGHRNRRVRGLPRLTARTAVINPYPHPFP